MRSMKFAEAIDDALAQAMADDPRIVVLGEDVHTLRLNLYVRFGPRRVCMAPISESALLGAAVGAAMAGLRPVVEIMLVDFIGVAMDALLNHAAKLEGLSGGEWKAPMVVRAACGGGYGDGGQHEQCLWGWLAHIPGLTVVVPATPADAGGLMLAGLRHDGPVVFLEHKLLSEPWLDFVGSGGRQSVSYDVPSAGAYGPVPSRWEPLPLGKAVLLRPGDDLTIVSLGVGIHRSLEAAAVLESEGVAASVVDLRCVSPLDGDCLLPLVTQSGRLLVVDEDYESFGLSGEVAACVLEAGIHFQYARVCTTGSIPYRHDLEQATLPGTARIVEAAHRLLHASGDVVAVQAPVGRANVTTTAG